MKVGITLVCENTAGPWGTLGEHGLAWWIQYGRQRLLFDTGQGLALMHNARRLGLDLGEAEAIVLSHGHYDHAGGLAAAWEACDPAARPRIYLHPAALGPKYAREADGTHRWIGMPPRARELAGKDSGATVVHTQTVTEIYPGLFVTGQIPRKSGFEAVGPHFITDPETGALDLIPDDQALFMPTSEGTVLLLGCTHSGLINTLEYVAELTGDRRFRLVAGGLHLHAASEERLAATLAGLERYRIAEIAAGHCTGARAAFRIWSAFPEAFTPLRVGTQFELAESA